MNKRSPPQDPGSSPYRVTSRLPSIESYQQGPPSSHRGQAKSSMQELQEAQRTTSLDNKTLCQQAIIKKRNQGFYTNDTMPMKDRAIKNNIYLKNHQKMAKINKL